MKRGIFDLEANGLLYGASQIWCIVIKDFDKGDLFKYGPSEIKKGIQHLESCKFLIGHNICGFDVPLIEKLYGVFRYNKLRDTLAMSKLANPDRPQGHSLESYGKQFGRYKPEHEDWSQYSPEMLHRCTEDVEINYLLYDWLLKKHFRKWDWIDSLELEQQFALEQAYQELEGVDINVDLAYEIVDKIDKEIEELDATLRPRLPKRIVKVGTNNGVKKIFKKDGSYQKYVQDWIDGSGNI